MIIDYRCRKPFSTRVGQFIEGKHTLVVGVDSSVIFSKKTGDFNMTIGENNSKVYSIPYEKLQVIRHTVWTNPKGREVWIIPLEDFEKEQNEKN